MKEASKFRAWRNVEASFPLNVLWLFSGLSDADAQGQEMHRLSCHDNCPRRQHPIFELATCTLRCHRVRDPLTLKVTSGRAEEKMANHPNVCLNSNRCFLSFFRMSYLGWKVPLLLQGMSHKWSQNNTLRTASLTRALDNQLVLFTNLQLSPRF